MAGRARGVVRCAVMLRCLWLVAMAMAACALAAPAYAQTVLYTETFDNGNATVASPTMIAPNPSGFPTYTGPAPVSMTYVADPAWTTSCNGWVAAWNSPIAYPPPLTATHCNPDPFVASIMWNRATENSQALGAYINNVGITTATAQNNLALTAYTSGAGIVTVGSLIMQNAAPVVFPSLPPGGTGRFVTMSIVAASQYCNFGPGLIQFSILNPAETQLGTGNINLCTDGINPQNYTGTAHGNGEAQPVRVATFMPTGANSAALVNGTGMTFRIRNQQPSNNGNDWGWDNFRVLDVSPSISKAVTPAVSYIGQAKTLTFTVTNTVEDNAAKVGWTFTDTLPANVTVAATPNATTTCGTGSTINATAGAGTIGVSGGNLPAGTPGGAATTCTVSVNVVSNIAGIYTNGPTNFTASTGLNLPAANINMEWVRNRLTVTKISNGGTGAFVFSNTNDSTAGTYTITTAAAGGPGTAAPARVLTVGSTTADTILTETPPAGWELTNAVCTGLSAGQTAARNGNVVTLPFAGLTAVTGGRDINCTLTNARQTTTLQLAKAWAAGSTTNDSVTIGATTGGTNNTVSFNTTAPTAANSGTPVVVTVGNVINLPAETGTNVGNYTTTLACTGGHTLSGTNGQTANTLTITSTNAAVCTYTNARQTATLTLQKAVVNDNGGTALNTAWTLVAAGPTSISGTHGAAGVTGAAVNTGTYTLSESGGPTAYTASAYSCSINGGAAADGNSVTLTGGQSAVCTITNNDQGATLTLRKTVVNNNGGTALNTAWTLAAAGPTSISGTHGAAAVTGAAVNIGTYTLSESGGPTDYAASAYSCSINGGAAVAGNSVTVTGGQAAVCTITNTFVPAPVLELTKTVGSVTDSNNNGINDAGDVINWTFRVRNTGNVAIADVTLADTLAGVTVVGGPIASLAAGGVDTTTFSASYTIQAGDVPNNVVNSATANGTGPGNTPVASPPSTTTTPTTGQPVLALVKTVGSVTDSNANGINDAGDVINWTFRVENTGNAAATNVTLADTLAGVTVVGGPIASLAAGGVDTTTFSASYTIQAGDVPNNVVNSATANGTGPGNTPVASPPSTTTTPTTGQPVLALVKTVGSVTDSNANGINDAGDVINWTFRVENTGNAAATNVTLADTLAGVTVVGGPIASLAAGGVDTTTFSASYTIQAGDVPNNVVNSATANGTGPGNTPVASPPSTTTTPTTGQPVLALVKTVGSVTDSNANGINDAGDVINWTFRVENTGNAAATNVTLADTLAGVTVVGGPIASLAAGGVDTTTFSASYTIQAGDVPNNVVNSATANGTGPGNTPVASPPSTTTTPTTGQPVLALVKTVGSVTDSNANGINDAGDVINWTFRVENTGNAAATNVTLADTLAGVTVVGGPIASLAAGGVDTTTFSASYTIQAGDVPNNVVNSATANGTGPGNTPVASPPSTTTTPTTGQPVLALVKTVGSVTDSNANGINDAGDVINWTFRVENTGNAAATNVTLADTLAGVTVVGGPIASLAAGGVDTTTFSASYTIQAGDVPNNVVNSATANGTGPGNTPVASPPSTTTTPTTGQPVLALVKTVGSVTDSNANGINDAGDVINWTFRVENTGNAAATNVTLADTLAGVTVVGGPIASLAAGGVDTTTFSASYTIQAGDVPNNVVNSATANGTGPGNTPVASPPSTTTTPTTGQPVLALVKTVGSVTDSNANGINDAGDVINWTFRVENTGNAAATNVTLADTLAGVTVVGGPIASLAAGGVDTTTFSASYTIQAGDVPNNVVNSATANGTGPGNTPVASPPSTTTTPTTGQPVLALVKTVGSVTDSNANGINDAGDVINWTFRVENTGNAAATNVTLADTLAGVTVVGGPIASLAAGGVDTTTFSASYTIQAGDVPNNVVNSATANGTGPGNTPVASPPSTTTTPTTGQPVLALVKTVGSVTDSNANGINDAGDVINWTFRVENTGNAAATNVTLADTLAGVTVVGGPIASLAAGGVDTTTFSASYTIQAGDVPNNVVNSATANGTGPGNTPVASPPSTTTTPTTGQPVLALVKTVGSVTDSNANGINDAGDVINWTFRVENTGNAAATNVTLADTLAGVTVVGGPIASLAAGGVDTTTFSASYTIQAGDVPNNVVNSATANGTGPGNTPVASPPSTTTTPTTGQPVLALVKTVGSVTDSNANGINDAGDVINWTFRVENTGNAAATNVTLADTLAGVTVVGGPIASLAAGGVDTTTFSASYTIQAGDVPNNVVNSATANGTGPGNTPVASPPSTTTTPTTGQPVLALVKTVGSVTDSNANGINDAGDVINWTFRVENTGNAAATNVTLADTLAGVTVVGGPIASLAAGGVDTTTFSASYTIQAGDVPNNVVNSATANGTGPGNTPVASPPSTTTTPTTGQPVLALVKTVGSVTDSNANGINDAGDVINWTFRVENTGNAAATNVTLADTLAGVTVVGGPIASLAAGGVDTTTFSASYTIQAGDVPNNVVNSATANGTGPGNTPVASPPSTTTTPTARTPPAPPVPNIEIVKLATLSTDNGTAGKGNAGDVITYSVTVRNTGNVTIMNLVVNDSFEGGVPTALTCTPTTLAAGEIASCQSYTHLITRAEAAAGGALDNRATASGTTSYGPVADTDEATVEVEPLPTLLRITKTAAPRDVRNGDLVRYMVGVENIGTEDAEDVLVVDTPPPGFTYVAGTLVVADKDGIGRLEAAYPIRVGQVDVRAGERATLTYMLRVGAGVRSGVHVNSAYAKDGNLTSNTATAEVQLIGDPMIDDTFILGTVFDDRDRDGWQDPANLSAMRAHGGFAPDAYIPNSSMVDRGAGMQPEADASAPLLHGIDLGKLSARQSDVDPVEAHRKIIRQTLREARFTDDFVLTTGQGLTYRMNAAGEVRVERSGDAAAGLTGADLVIERKISQAEDGVIVDYVITNHGVDERGIPGVRVASVEGLISETDQFGRYHMAGVPGGPWERGRNFVLKVDTATLPPGAEFTTDNPLLRRITPGIPVRFDFGAKLPEGKIGGGKVIAEVELGTIVFAPGSARIRPGAEAALDRIAEQMREQEGGEVVISANGESQRLAYERAKAVREALVGRIGTAVATATVVTLRTEISDPKTAVLTLADKPLLGEIFFDTDKTTIRPEYIPVIASIAADIEKAGGGVVGIVGHADQRGSDAYNIDLAMRRSKAVFEAISEQLTPPSRSRLKVEISGDPGRPLGIGGQ